MSILCFFDKIIVAYVIANGTIVANGTPRQIVSTSEAKKLYFGEDFKI